MKMFKYMKFISLSLLLLLVIMIGVPTEVMAAQPTVNLGKTTSFAVLAGETITNTGNTTINGDAGGDVGLHPGTAFTGQASTTIGGGVHLADGVAEQAKVDLVTAYNDAAGRTPVTTIATELGGQILEPGVYNSESGTFEIKGTLTLDAKGDPNGVFIFQTKSTLVTGVDSKVSLINGARFCRVFWQVGSSATLGVSSHFVGHIFAMESITANNNATIQGQLLARNGAVTLDNNTITNGICAEATEEKEETEITEITEITEETGTPAAPVVTKTETGGELPKTSTNSYNLLLIGGSLVLIGGMIWRNRKRYE